ncbi:hypothetical protein N1851_003512 [Merluccius polli]|uniref:Uncharacterized protein n=1 Tax=Merluccius polli TaxID=89951 RepID=A0AA47N8J9_MERPO|nr:hypothetical protein N1851_003512 [Merluccius polli]
MEEACDQIDAGDKGNYSVKLRYHPDNYQGDMGVGSFCQIPCSKLILPVSVTNYSAKTSSVNEDSSASQDISSLPAQGNVHSPESEEPTDLDGSLSDELIQFKHFVQNETSPVQLLQALERHGLKTTFPNVYVALRLFLTLPVSNCEVNSCELDPGFVCNRFAPLDCQSGGRLASYPWK